VFRYRRTGYTYTDNRLVVSHYSPGCQFPVKILPLAHQAKINFEAYPAKFEAPTCTNFTKDDGRTIAVTNNREGGLNGAVLYNY